MSERWAGSLGRGRERAAPGAPQTSLEDFFHELQTPLAVAKGSLDTARRHWDRLDDGHRRTTVARAADAVDDLVKATIELSHMFEDPTVGTSQGRLEDALAAIPGVGRVTIEESLDARTVHVHVVPEVDRTETERQVRSVLQRVLGDAVRTDLRIGTTKGSPVAGRRKLWTLATKRSGGRFMAKVWLELGGDVLSGEDKGGVGATSQQRVVAGATISALSRLISRTAELHTVEVARLGEERTALVRLTLGDLSTVGAAVVRTDSYDAIARATLDALNRHIMEATSADGRATE